jgi:hypothetical protein
MRVQISDDGLRSLIDMDMLHSDVLVTTVAKAAIGLELGSERPLPFAVLESLSATQASSLLGPFRPSNQNDFPALGSSEPPAAQQHIHCLLNLDFQAFRTNEEMFSSRFLPVPLSSGIMFWTQIRISAAAARWRHAPSRTKRMDASAPAR